MLPALRGWYEVGIFDAGFLMRTSMTTSGTDVFIRRLLKGAAAGFVATAPMSISMLTGWMLLPRQEKYPLPPRLTTEEMSERVGLEDRVNENELVGFTILSHFGYGALFGSAYALYHEKVPVAASLKGALMGLAVWVGSYLGWLPAMGILQPATRHPWRRNLMMIIAHVVWGVTLGQLTRKLTDRNWK